MLKDYYVEKVNMHGVPYNKVEYFHNSSGAGLGRAQYEYYGL